MNKDIASQLSVFNRRIDCLARANRMVEVGITTLQANRPWKPLIPRHEFEEWMKYPEVRDVMYKATKLVRHSRIPNSRTPPPVARALIPVSIETDDPVKYARTVFKMKYIRDNLLVTDRFVHQYKEYIASDIPALNELIRPWFNQQWDRATWKKEINYAK